MAGEPGPGPSAAKGRRPNPRIAQLRRTWYFLSRNTLAMVGLCIIVAFVFVAIYSFSYNASSTALDQYCGSYVPGTGQVAQLPGACIQVCTYQSGTAPPGPNCYAVDTYNAFLPPTLDLAHLKGGPLPLGSLSTTPGNYYYSIYQGFVKGAPWSLGIAAGIVLVGASIGLLLGSVAGYLGGYVDEGIMRVTDVFLSIPAILLVLILLSTLGGLAAFSSFAGRIGVLMLAFIVTWWPIYTRIVRGQVLVTREQKYVEASKASGARTGRILARHIIPNSLYPIFVQMSLDVGTIPLLLGALVFLGFHIFPTPYFPEWGSMSALAILILPTQMSSCFADIQLGIACVFPWWQLVFPGLIIFLFAISVNFLSDGLRDALDPRLRR
jgi:peptide/nickel transport system permease protein